MKLINIEIAGKPEALVCAHWRSFPPKGAVVESGANPEELRKKKLITEPEYQRLLVWQKVCGLLKMDPDKCLTCPHARTAGFKRGLPVLVTLDGKLATPTLDLPSLESSARHRSFLASVTKPRGE